MRVDDRRESTGCGGRGADRPQRDAQDHDAQVRDAQIHVVRRPVMAVAPHITSVAVPVLKRTPCIPDLKPAGRDLAKDSSDLGGLFAKPLRIPSEAAVEKPVHASV